MERPTVQTLDSGESGSSADSQDDQLGLGIDGRRTPGTNSMSSLDQRPPINSLNSSIYSRGSADGSYINRTEIQFTNSSLSSINGAARPPRPTAPARTPSNTYAPARRPPQPPYMSISERKRSGSTSRFRQDPNSSYLAQDKLYRQRITQDQPTEYFSEPYTPSLGYGTGSDTEEDSPLDVHFDNDPYEQETLLFYGNDDIQPTTEDLKDPANRERLEWHGMLASVLTGDVVRQEKKRLIGASDKQGENLYTEIWIGLRSKMCGRTLAAQRRIIEDTRSTLDTLLDQIVGFQVQGESEAGKPPIEQVRDVVKKIEKCESLYPSQMALEVANISLPVLLNIKLLVMPLYHGITRQSSSIPS